jgi:hypothetical protein
MQPVIDEQGLNPSEFNLIASIYLTKYENMRTYKKDRRYIGALPERDFHYLDSLLLNLDQGMRRELVGKQQAFESEAK